VPKKDGDHWPVINLKAFNRFIVEELPSPGKRYLTLSPYQVYSSAMELHCDPASPTSTTPTPVRIFSPRDGSTVSPPL